MKVELVKELEIDEDTGEVAMLIGDVTNEEGKFVYDDKEIKKNIKRLNISLFNQANSISRIGSLEEWGIISTFVYFGRIYSMITCGGNG
jgi:hypothetical protein